MKLVVLTQTAILTGNISEMCLFAVHNTLVKAEDLLRWSIW